MNEKTCALLHEIETLKAENQALKEINANLSQAVAETKTWKYLRDYKLMPMLRFRYGYGDCVYSGMCDAIFQVAKMIVGINRKSEVNELNYERVKEISVAITELVCTLGWEHLEELQKKWNKSHVH